MEDTSAASAITRQSVMDVLRKVQDPEINHDVVTMGIIREVEVEGRDVSVYLQVTSAGCPFKDELTNRVRTAVAAMPGVGRIEVGSGEP